MTIVPDRHGTGTNALLLAPPDVIAPAFGQGSCARHRAAAEASGARVAVAEVASLALDVDTPDDLDALRGVHLQDARRRHTPAGPARPGRTALGVVVTLAATALPGLPEVRPGDDLAALLAGVATGEHGLRDGDALAIAHKVVSKAEGRVRDLADVAPGDRARALAAAHAKDPRAVQVVLDETEELLRAERGVLICRTRHGFVCANAGVDASNAGGEGRLVLLPVDPDASARALRARMRELTGAAPAVVITDSFGRAWRHGQCDVAIGCAGLAALRDWRAGATPRAASCGQPGSPSPTRPPRRRTWPAPRTLASPPSGCAGSERTSPSPTARAPPSSCRPPDEDLFR